MEIVNVHLFLQNVFASSWWLVDYH